MKRKEKKGLMKDVATAGTPPAEMLPQSLGKNLNENSG